MSVLNYSGSSCCSVLSDNSENSLEDTPPPTNFTPVAMQLTDNICRDFLRNVCKRGAHCRYRHPSLNSSASSQIALAASRSTVEPVFCHDFQNTSGCQRPTCRFVHCTREQEETWKLTGRLPGGILMPSVDSNNGLDSNGVVIVANNCGTLPPVCMDFMKAECKRGQKCKYRHLSSAEYEAETLADHQSALQMAAVEAAAIFEETSNIKRRRLSDGGRHVSVDGPRYIASEYSGGTSEHRRYRSPQPTAVVSLTDYQLLEEDNRFLRHKVDDLKRHISVLVATNELLLDQNARYRSTMMTVPPPSIVAVSQVNII